MTNAAAERGGGGRVARGGSLEGGKSMAEFSGVWRPGTGAQYWKSDMDADEFKSLNDGYFDQGLRLVRYQRDGDSRLALWRPGSGEQRVHGGVSFDKFTDLGNDYFKKDLRIVDFHTGPSSGDLWAGVWRPGTGPQKFRAGLSWDEFKTQDLAFYKQGLRIV